MTPSLLQLLLVALLVVILFQTRALPRIVSELGAGLRAARDRPERDGSQS